MLFYQFFIFKLFSDYKKIDIYIYSPFINYCVTITHPTRYLHSKQCPRHGTVKYVDGQFRKSVKNSPPRFPHYWNIVAIVNLITIVVSVDIQIPTKPFFGTY